MRGDGRVACLRRLRRAGRTSGAGRRRGSAGRTARHRGSGSAGAGPSAGSLAGQAGQASTAPPEAGWPFDKLRTWLPPEADRHDERGQHDGAGGGLDRLDLREGPVAAFGREKGEATHRPGRLLCRRPGLLSRRSRKRSLNRLFAA